MVGLELVQKNRRWLGMMKDWKRSGNKLTTIQRKLNTGGEKADTYLYITKERARNATNIPGPMRNQY